jgi:Flp pilus assembly pilin Flp
MFPFFVSCYLRVLARARADERGQSTAEYALVILGAVGVASLLLTWAVKSNAISKLFDSIVGKVLSKVIG